MNSVVPTGVAEAHTLLTSLVGGILVLQFPVEGLAVGVLVLRTRGAGASGCNNRDVHRTRSVSGSNGHDGVGVNPLVVKGVRRPELDGRHTYVVSTVESDNPPACGQTSIVAQRIDGGNSHNVENW